MDRRMTHPNTQYPPDTAVVPAAPATPFAAYLRPPAETPATIAARRALMSRKGIPAEAMEHIAMERRRKEVGLRDGLARHLPWVAAVAAGLLAAWTGSRMAWQPLLLAGYALAALGTVGTLARLTHRPAMATRSLEHYYLPDERLARAEDIALLRRLAAADAEIEIATAAWWRDPAPIRTRDVRLALDLHRAKQDAGTR